MPHLLNTNNDSSYFAINNKDEKYRAIVENSIHAFFLTTSDGKILETNQAAIDLFEYTAEEFRQLRNRQIIDNTFAVLLSGKQLCEKNGFTVTEATGVKKSGVRFAIEISATVFTDFSGDIKYSSLISDITLRKKAEAALQLSNERYNLVVKATKDLVWDWDLVTGEIYRSGDSLMNVYGHSSNDHIKKNKDWASFIHPLDKDRIKAQIDYYIDSAEEKDFNLEYRFKREDGTYMYINDKGYIIRNTTGKAIRIIGAAEDITERKKTALAIEESEQRYKIFVQQSTEGIWRIELKEAVHIYTPMEQMLEYCYQNAYVAECNDKFAIMYGYKNAQQMIGCKLSSILPAENPANAAYFFRFFSNGFKVHEEISYELDKDGNELVLLNNMIGIIEGDYIKRAWGTQRNITHQVKAERDLKERENHLKAIVDTDPECIKLLSKEGIILEMNPSGVHMIGAENAEQVLGKNALTLILPEYHDAFIKLLEDNFKGETGKLEFEVIGLHGKRLYMETHSVPLKNAAGNIISALSVTRDITEKIQLENSLNEERKIRLQQITEAVITGQEKERTALGEELHDNINQILASTKLYIECAMKDTNPRMDLVAESKVLVEKAMTEIRKLSKSLLPPSLGETGLLQALHELVEDMEEVNEPAIVVEWHVADENSICSKLKLTIFRIVQEQLNNIIKHAEAKNVIITIEDSGGLLVLIVKDDGLGFNTSLKRNGVGLRNISSRAEVNNGQVSIVSKPGEGCELIVKFFSNTSSEKTIINI